MGDTQGDMEGRPGIRTKVKSDSCAHTWLRYSYDTSSVETLMRSGMLECMHCGTVRRDEEG
jgi:hypothetical protein